MKDDLIGKLVNETMKGASGSSESNVVSLTDYFENKINNVQVHTRRHPVENVNAELLQLNLPFCVGEFKNDTQVIKIKHNKVDVEIPINWSEFSMLNPDENFSFFAIDKDIDRTDLLNLFSDILEENLFSILGALKGNKFYLVGFRHDEYSLMGQVLEITKGIRTYRKIA